MLYPNVNLVPENKRKKPPKLISAEEKDNKDPFVTAAEGKKNHSKLLKDALFFFVKVLLLVQPIKFYRGD